MSAEVKITQRGLFKKLPKFEELLMPDMKYGVMDDGYRLDDGKTGEYTVVYFPEFMHRGFELHIEKNSVFIRQPYPTSEKEIHLFCDYIRFLCGKLNAKDFEWEGNKTDLNNTENYITDSVSVCKSALKHMLTEIEEKGQTFYIFGIMNPIALGAKEMDEIGDDLDKFGEYLHRLQSMDVFYPDPQVFRRKDGKVFAFYVLTIDLPSVVPTIPKILMSPKTKVDEWYIVIFDGSTNKQAAAFDFFEFLENIDKSEIYDAEHFLLTLRGEDVEKLKEKCRMCDI